MSTSEPMSRRASSSSSSTSSTSTLSRSPPTVGANGRQGLGSSTASPLSARAAAGGLLSKSVNGMSGKMGIRGSPIGKAGLVGAGGARKATSGVGGGSSGELRELGDDELRRLSRDDLIKVLRAEWEQADRHALEVAEITQARDTLQTSCDEQASLLSQHAHAEDELEKVHAKTESEMASKLEIMAKLRDRVSELEREKRDTDKRYAEQTLSFEAERQALYDNEQHLKSRLITLSRRPSPHPSVSPSPSPVAASFPTDVQSGVDVATLTAETTRLAKLLRNETEEKENIKRDLGTMETGYHSLQEALERSREELSDLKQLNLGLQEEIESFSLLLVERTISGKMGNNELLSRSYRNSSEGVPSLLDRSSTSSPDNDDSWSFRERASLGSVNEEDELDPDLVGERESVGGDSAGAAELDPDFGEIEPRDLDAEEFKSTPRARHKKATGPAGKDKVERVLKGAGVLGGAKKPKGESLADFAVTGSGLDLAAELGRAEEGVEEGQLRKLGKGDDGEAIRSEVKALKEANKALTLYCSKILDRIMSVEGFEDVLSADHGSLQGSVRRVVSGRTYNAKKPSPPRKSAQDAFAEPVAAVAASRPTPPPITTTTGRFSHGRSQSLSVVSPVPLGIGRPNLLSRDTAPPAKISPPLVATPPVKKARPSSIDWKGGFASLFSPTSSPLINSSPSPAFPSPGDSAGKLKPLRLSTVASPPRPTREPSPMSPSLGGRRVDRAEEEEEEEDRLQRERVELLQRQLKSEEGETNQGSGMGKTSSSQFGRRSSSARSFGATSPLGSSSPRMSNPIDTMVERLEGGEASYGAGGAQEGGRVSYFPRLTGPEGLVAGAEVTEEMVASRLATLDLEERRKAEEISSGRGGGLSLPSRSNSISQKRRVSAAASRGSANSPGDGGPSAEEREWLGGGRMGGRKTSSGPAEAGETLFHYPDDE